MNEYRTLDKDEIIREGDETDRCVNPWKDDAKWKRVLPGEIGNAAPDPHCPAHRIFRRPVLVFEFFGDEGTWEAFSKIHDQMNPFRWIIKVCQDGRFDVNASDSELCNGVKAFDTFAEAKAFCQLTEESLVHNGC